MRKVLFILSLLCITSVLVAQKGRDAKRVDQEIFNADDHYNNEEYYLASLLYMQILELDPDNVYLNYMLGESYRHYFEYELAEMAYAKTLELDKDNAYPLTSYWYAVMQKMNGKYEEAEKTFELFLSTFQPQTPDEEIYLEYALLDYNGCVLALDEMSKPLRDYSFENLGEDINTIHLEFAPNIYKHDSSIVFTSSREGSKGEDQYTMFGESFTDNYRYEYSHGKWHKLHGEHDHFDNLNTIRNDGSGCFSHDFQKFYYTICGEETEGECAIYVSQLNSHGKWDDPVKLNENINMPGYWNAQPALSGSDDTLYFVSKRPGGYGMHDIWYSTKNGPGEMWGEAKNLGDKVNTAFIDMCPDFHVPTHSLFFASTGHEGFGGLDIFQARSITDSIRNMGLPFNSNRDDFYFVMGDNKGYLSSNRRGGIGHDDLYWFNYRSHREVLAELRKDTSVKSINIEGKILTAETREPVENVNVLLTDKENLEIKIATTDNEGKFKFNNLSSMEDYLLQLKEKDKRLTDDIEYILDQIKLTKSQEEPKISLFENIYFDFDKATLRPEAKLTLDLLIDFQKDHPDLQLELKAYTDNFGTDEYNDKLSRRRGEAAFEYLIAHGLPKTGIVISANGEGSPIATNDNPIGRQLNRRVEFYVLGDDRPNSEFMTYIVEPKMNIKKVAEKFNMTKDEIKDANGLRRNKLETWRPLRVKRGDINDMIAPQTRTASAMESYAEYNLTVDVIPTGGPTREEIRKEDVEVVFYNRGSKEGKNVPSTSPSPILVMNNFDIYNSYNLQGNEDVYAREGEEIYIVKPLDILAKIAREYNMTVTELKTINGLTSNKIQIGQRLRVRKKK